MTISIRIMHRNSPYEIREASFAWCINFPSNVVQFDDVFYHYNTVYDSVVLTEEIISHDHIFHADSASCCK